MADNIVNMGQIDRRPGPLAVASEALLRSAQAKAAAGKNLTAYETALLRAQGITNVTQMKDTTAEDVAQTRADTSMTDTSMRSQAMADKTDYDNQVKLLLQADKSASAQSIAAQADNTRLASAAIATPGDQNQALINAANQKNLEAIRLKKQNDDMEFKNAQKLHEDFTMKHEYLSQDAQANFKAQGHHDEVTKQIAKGYGISPKEVPQLNPVDIYKKNIQATITSIPARIKAKQPLDAQTKATYQAVRKYGVDDTALAAHMAAKDPNVDHKDPNAVHQAIIQKATLIKQARNQDQGQDKSQSKSQDPLGILGQ